MSQFISKICVSQLPHKTVFVMESINLRIQNWESRERDEISYSLSIKVPPKDDLLRLLPEHMNKLMYDWKCFTGILSTVEHSLKLCLYREYHEPKIGIFIFIQNSQESGSNIANIVEAREVDVTYVSENSTVEDTMSRNTPPKPLEIPGYEFFQSTCGWPEKTSILFLLLHVCRRKPPKIILDEVEIDNHTPLPEESQTGSKSISISSGILHTEKYFLSEECSDATVICGNVRFPVHRIILCSQSSYFSSMFSSSMKESSERVVTIEDMSPASVKELLRFIYTGDLADPVEKTNAKELFVAGDKYGMLALKGRAERALLEGLSVENAMELYHLGKLHRSSALTRRAKQVILWNKGKFAPDPETLKDFTCNYPELVFELLQTS